MFICMQKVNFTIHLFLRYYILKNLAISLVLSILAHISKTSILPDMDWWWNINNNISFHFRLFPRKNNDKILQKIHKNRCWRYFGPFFPKFGQKWVFLEKRSQFFHKMAKWQTDRETDQWRETDNSDFIGLSIGQ